MKSYLRILLIVVASLLSSCISSYDAQAQKDLTNLKAFHLKVIDENKPGSSSRYSASKVNQKQDEGELLFRQAIAYSEMLGDNLRTNNLNDLKANFHQSMDMLEKPTGPENVATAEQRDLCEEGYNLAIEGEKARPGAPGN